MLVIRSDADSLYNLKLLLFILCKIMTSCGWLAASLVVLFVCGPRCSSAQVEAGAAVDVFTAGEGGYFCIKIPSLVRLPGGLLLAFGEARTDNCSDFTQTALVSKRSVDGGATWSALTVVHAEPGKVIGNAAPVVLPSGRVLLPFCRNNLQVLQTYSDDQGQTWALPRLVDNVTRPDWRWIGLGPPTAIRLRSGRLLVPAYHDLSPHWEDGTFTHVHLLLSDDQGETWRIGAEIDGRGHGDDYSNECSAVELASTPNAVLVNARSLGSYRVQLRSLDGGETFAGSPEIKRDLPQPLDGCEGAMVALPNGTLWLTNPAALTLRFNLTLHASDDAGHSWRPILVIDPLPSAYTALVLLDSQTVGLLYERAPPPPRAVFVPSAITFLNLTVVR